MARLPDEEMIIIHSMDEIPRFADEREEHEFWKRHTLADNFWKHADPPNAEEQAILERARRKRQVQQRPASRT